MTYSFEREDRLANLRLLLPATEAKLPSISGEYWCIAGTGANATDETIMITKQAKKYRCLCRSSGFTLL